MPSYQAIAKENRKVFALSILSIAHYSFHLILNFFFAYLLTLIFTRYIFWQALFN